MGIIADIVILVIIAAAVFLGVKRGLIRSLAGMVVLVAALFGAAWAARVFSPAVAQWLRPLLEQSLLRRVETQSHTATPGDMLSVFGYSGQTLSELAESVAEQVRQTGQALANAVVDSVLHSIAYAVVYVVSFLILLIALYLAVKALDLAAKLPGIRTANGFLGGVLGLIKGILLVFLAVWILQKLQLLRTPELTEQSFLLPLFIHNSPIGLVAALLGDTV
ncbi:MAG: CvpA family protein [Oscillospiraceae bacterium]|nr:CvpA family protein [Oscillospiraceae bacterium]